MPASPSDKLPYVPVHVCRPATALIWPPWPAPCWRALGTTLMWLLAMCPARWRSTTCPAQSAPGWRCTAWRRPLTLSWRHWSLKPALRLSRQHPCKRQRALQLQLGGQQASPQRWWGRLQSARVHLRLALLRGRPERPLAPLKSRAQQQQKRPWHSSMPLAGHAMLTRGRAQVMWRSRQQASPRPQPLHLLRPRTRQPRVQRSSQQRPAAPAAAAAAGPGATCTPSCLSSLGGGMWRRHCCWTRRLACSTAWLQRPAPASSLCGAPPTFGSTCSAPVLAALPALLLPMLRLPTLGLLRLHRGLAWLSWQ